MSNDPVQQQDEPRVVLSARGLGKDFFGFTAVNNVDLDVHHASIHALIGPNGAGKTTVFNLLTKFLQPTRGRLPFWAPTSPAQSPTRWRVWAWCGLSRYRPSFRT